MNLRPMTKRLGVAALVAAIPAMAWAAEHFVSPGETPLQAVISQATAGDVLILSSGDHRGPVTIDKPLVLAGEKGATVFGNGKGSVVTIASSGVTVRGLTVTGSGRDLTFRDSGIYAAQEATGAVIEPLAATDLVATASDVAWLPAGVDGAAPRELRLRSVAGDSARSVPLGLDGVALAALPNGRLALLGWAGEGAHLLVIDPRDGHQSTVATTRWRVRGPLTVSPDGRYAVAVWPDNELWVAATDGADSLWLPGRAARWLPLQGWRSLAPADAE